MTKTILKAIGVTFASVFAILVLIVLGTSLIFPSFMAKTTAKLGLYSMASQYAVMEYDRTGDVEDISAAFEYAVFAEDDNRVISCAERYMEHEQFVTHCKDLQYVAGNLSVSLYRVGEKEKAVGIAFGASPIYTARCAIKYLCVEVASCKDKETSKVLYEKLSSIGTNERTEYERLLAILKNV